MKTCRTKAKFAGLCLIAGLHILGPDMAMAEDVKNVSDQAMAAHYPEGIQTGSVQWFPTLTVRETFDDNIYKTNTNEASDVVTLMAPALGIKSDLDMHEIAVSASGKFGFYHENASENYKDYAVKASGRFDLDYKTYLYGSAEHQKTHEDRSEPENIRSDDPITYNLDKQTVGYKQERGLIKLNLEANHKNYSYDKATLNGASLNTSARDKDDYDALIKLAYELAPGYDLYSSLKYIEADYKNPASAPNSFKGYEVQVGSDVYITGQVKGNVYGGYIRQNYESGSPDICTVTAGLGVLWNINQIWSLEANLWRSAYDTTVLNSAGYISDNADIALQYAFLDNWIFELSGTGMLQDYQTRGAASREDEVLGAGAKSEYFFSEGMSLALGWNYVQRSSNQAASEYDSNRIMLTFTKSF